MERRCGESREACSAGDETLVARSGRRQATSDDDGTSALMTAEPEIATPGPMYAGVAGAGVDSRPDDVPAASVLAATGAAERGACSHAGCAAATATAEQNTRTADQRARKRM